MVLMSAMVASLTTVMMVTNSAAMSGLVCARYMSPPRPDRNAVTSSGVHLAVVCFARSGVSV